MRAADRETQHDKVLKCDVRCAGRFDKTGRSEAIEYVLTYPQHQTWSGWYGMRTRHTNNYYNNDNSGGLSLKNNVESEGDDGDSHEVG